ncbi:MAG TPA: AMP-binding protein [Candidatus Nanopelagicaceae bacterium]
MDTTSQRELLPVPAECSITQVMVDLAKALAGTGPALGFGDLKSTHVPHRVAVVIGTSGSTGTPKEVGLSSSALLASARASNKFLGATYGEKWSLLLPLTHIAGVNVLVRSLELGTFPMDLRNATEYPKADFTAIVPTQLFRALNGDGALLEHLVNCRAVLVGGAALTDAISSQAAELGIKIVSTYGMTETSGGCVYAGTPLNSVEVGITTEGVIKIKGPILASTYLNDAAGWDRANIDGWFVTNDLGKMESGRLIIQGRIDDVIVSGGEKISLSAVEAVLSSQFSEHEFSAFAVPDEEWGAALYVAIAGRVPVPTNEVNVYLTKRLGHSAKPKGFLTLATLPLIGVGKVDKAALVQLAIQERQSPR